MAPQRDKIFKQKVNDCVQYVILQTFSNFHAIRSWNFHNICNEIGWPRFVPLSTHSAVEMLHDSALYKFMIDIDIDIDIFAPPCICR